MAKEKKQVERTAEQIYEGKELKTGVPVSSDKDFVLISYSDAVKLQRMNIFGIGRRLKKIVKAHKVKHGMIDLSNIDVNKPKTRKQILDDLSKRKEAERLAEKEAELAKLKGKKK